MTTILLDNGASAAKIGLSSQEEPRIVPNCVIKAKNVRNRIFVGDQIEDCKDLSGLFYILPFQKGYLVNWEVERQVWDHCFGKDGLKVKCEDSSMLVTEPYFNFVSIQEAMNEMLFEEYQFQAIYRANASCLAQHARQQEHKSLCSLVVDSGYSFTHLVPYYDGKKIKDCIRRINVGGKVLTNHLKEVISYRQLMVMDETYVINQMKEDVCYVSTQFSKDMDIARLRGKENTVVRDYILPDYTHIKRGYVRPVEETNKKSKGDEQIIRMNNERFAVPEILFHPSDVGIQEMGIAEAIVFCINNTPEEMHPHFFSNIILVGGNCMLPGFQQRVQTEVRALAPQEFEVNVFMPKNSVTYPWTGGKLLSQKDNFLSKLAVTKEEYDEHGHSICFEKFDV